METEGRIAGKPTLLVIFKGHLDAQNVLSALQKTGYPAQDVSIYYRLPGTDQVVDALTGLVAAGQSITQTELDPRQLDNADTLMLMHPDIPRYEVLKPVLGQLGNPEVLYSGDTEAEGVPGGIERTDERPV